MGTRWRGLLAPIDKPTGDGRRMKAGAFTHRELPLALKWQRVDDEGHDASVVVGLVDALTIDEKAGEVWGEGELFDDQPNLPRLTEDVAEAKLMLSKQVIGPSVDAGAADAVLVEQGTEEPLTDQRMEELYLEAERSGQQPKVEILFTHYEIAAATLVVIPAFAEARPFELIQQEQDTPEAEPVEAEPVKAALVASLTAAAAVYPAEWFADPQLSEVTPITITDDGRVFGHAAQWGVCHLAIPVCTTAPNSGTDYALFHRYPINTSDGISSVGRLTTGHGRVGTGCTDLLCRGHDDHACDYMSLTETIAHYDRLKVLAWLRSGEDEHGIWMAGVLAGPIDEDDRQVLARRMVSGHWSPVGAGHEMVEVLALAREKPGFPLKVSFRNGRQGAIVAAGGVDPTRLGKGPERAPLLDMKALGDYIVTRLAAVASAPTEPVGLPVPDDDQAEPVENPAADEAAALIAEVELTVANADPEAIERAGQASELLGDLEELEPASV